MSTAPRIHEYEAELVVTRRDEVADDVIALTFEDASGNPLQPWTPGAHIDLILEPKLVRQYSLCSSPSDTRSYRVGILRSPTSRGGSEFVHEKLTVGSKVLVRGPRNHFPLVRADRYQFIAGGIGVTPMLPMIEAARAFGADWHLLYGGRERKSMAFVDELAAFGDNVEIWPQDEFGLLDLASVLGDPRPGTVVYCCGPEGLLDAVEKGCSSWPPGSLHIERFAPKTTAEQSEAAGLEQFEVVCQRSGITLVVEQDRTVLEVLEEAQVDVMGSCLEGTCGSCESFVLEGTPEHRDSVLTEDERAANDRMFPCVSRSLSKRLVLDL